LRRETIPHEVTEMASRRQPNFRQDLSTRVVPNPLLDEGLLRGSGQFDVETGFPIEAFGEITIHQPERRLIVYVAGSEIVQRVAIHPIGHGRVNGVILKRDQVMRRLVVIVIGRGRCFALHRLIGSGSRRRTIVVVDDNRSHRLLRWHDYSNVVGGSRIRVGGGAESIRCREIGSRVISADVDRVGGNHTIVIATSVPATGYPEPALTGIDNAP
jgi:hypothetical protein